MELDSFERKRSQLEAGCTFLPGSGADARGSRCGPHREFPSITPVTHELRSRGAHTAMDERATKTTNETTGGTVHSFRLNVAGADVMSNQAIDALFEAGCDDATFGRDAGVQYGEFHREAPSLEDAVLSAIRDVELVSGLQVIRVEPDEMVGVSEIAARVGRTRESIRQLARGLRGPGDFPPPALLLNRARPVWHWTDVAGWFLQRYSEDERVTGSLDPDISAWHFIAAINGALELRNHTEGVPKPTVEQIGRFARQGGSMG